MNVAKSLFDKTSETIGPEENPPEFDVFLPVYLAGVQILQPHDSGLCTILDNKHLFGNAPYLRFRYECRFSAMWMFDEGTHTYSLWSSAVG